VSKNQLAYLARWRVWRSGVIVGAKCVLKFQTNVRKQAFFFFFGKKKGAFSSCFWKKNL